jgi:hypothetical protein
VATRPDFSFPLSDVFARHAEAHGAVLRRRHGEIKALNREKRI